MENQQDYLSLFADNIKQELFDPTEKSNNLCDSNEEKVGEFYALHNLAFKIYQFDYTFRSKISIAHLPFKFPAYNESTLHKFRSIFLPHSNLQPKKKIPIKKSKNYWFFFFFLSEITHVFPGLSHFLTPHITHHRFVRSFLMRRRGFAMRKIGLGDEFSPSY